MVKNCYKKIESSEGELFLNTFPHDDCLQCVGVELFECEKFDCPIEKILRWKGSRKTSNGVVYICANYGKNKGLLSDFDSITGSIRTLCNTKNEILRYREEDSVKRIRRVLHNIRSINAHALMEMRGIVPEYFYKQHMKEILINVAKHISKDSQKTTHGILEIAKDLYQIKTEFSVYNKLIKGNVALDKRNFNIRDVLMTVVYPFFGDFTKKNVIVDIQPYRESVLFDFETIQVAFYHIIENTAKYVKPNTHVSITFPIEDKFQKVKFCMKSLHIEESEIEKIFSEGYSGKQAIKTQLHGEGIGLYRARKLVEENQGNLMVIPGEDIVMFGGIEYSTNNFIVAIPIY